MAKGILKRERTKRKMWVYFTAGMLCGVYLEQTYALPNVKKACARLLNTLKSMEK